MDCVAVNPELEPTSANVMRDKSANAKSAASAKTNGVAENVGRSLTGGTCRRRGSGNGANFYYFVCNRVIQYRSQRFRVHEHNVAHDRVFEECLVLQHARIAYFCQSRLFVIRQKHKFSYGSYDIGF